MEYEYQKTNREKKMSPEFSGEFWCYRCDMALVHIGQKCHKCGFRCGKRTIKKESNA